MDEAAAHARVIVHLHIADDLLDEDVAGHRLHVQFPLHGRPVLAVDGPFQKGELLLDPISDLFVGVVRILDRGGHIEDLRPEVVRRPGLVPRPVVDVQGQEDALVGVQLHAVSAFLHLLGDHIQAQVLPVQGDGGVTDVVRIRQAQFLRQVEARQVHHVGDVPVVGKQDPVLVRSHPEEGDGLVQLDPVGLLGIPVPGGVAAAADLSPRLQGIRLLPRHLHGAGPVVRRVLGIHRHAAVGGDVDPGDDVRREIHLPVESRDAGVDDDVLPAGNQSGGHEKKGGEAFEGHFRWNL